MKEVAVLVKLSFVIDRCAVHWYQLLLRSALLFIWLQFVYLQQPVHYHLSRFSGNVSAVFFFQLRSNQWELSLNNKPQSSPSFLLLRWNLFVENILQLQSLWYLCIAFETLFVFFFLLVCLLVPKYRINRSVQRLFPYKLVVASRNDEIHRCKYVFYVFTAGTD